MVAKKILIQQKFWKTVKKKFQNTENEMDNLIKKKHSESIQNV